MLAQNKTLATNQPTFDILNSNFKAYISRNTISTVVPIYFPLATPLCMCVYVGGWVGEYVCAVKAFFCVCAWVLCVWNRVMNYQTNLRLKCFELALVKKCNIEILLLLFIYLCVQISRRCFEEKPDWGSLSLKQRAATITAWSQKSSTVLVMPLFMYCQAKSLLSQAC